MKAIRQSNFEVMRLMCMLFIVIYHVFIHVVISTAGNERIYAALITVFHIGVLDFVMISGYFGIKHSWKSFSKLYGYTALYSLLGVICKTTLGGGNFEFNDVVSVVFPFSNGVYWFMTTYFVLFLIAPYVDMALSKLDNKGMLVLIACLFYVVVVYGFIFKKGLGDGRSIIAFLLMYVIGRFLHYNESLILEIPKRRLICISSFIVLFLLITWLPSPYTNYVKGLTFPYNSPGLYIMAALFFIIFMGWEYKNKIVNAVAASTFAIYLIHGNRYLMEMTIPYIKTLFANNSVSHNIFVAFVLSLAIFVLCIIIDQIIKYTLSFLTRLVSKSPNSIIR